MCYVTDTAELLQAEGRYRYGVVQNFPIGQDQPVHRHRLIPVCAKSVLKLYLYEEGGVVTFLLSTWHMIKL